MEIKIRGAKEHNLKDIDVTIKDGVTVSLDRIERYRHNFIYGSRFNRYFNPPFYLIDGALANIFLFSSKYSI